MASAISMKPAISSADSGTTMTTQHRTPRTNNVEDGQATGNGGTVVTYPGQRCNCCPYNYHIDLDFLRFLEQQSPPDPLRTLRRIRRSPKRSLADNVVFDYSITSTASRHHSSTTHLEGGVSENLEGGRVSHTSTNDYTPSIDIDDNVMSPPGDLPNTSTTAADILNEINTSINYSLFTVTSSTSARTRHHPPVLLEMVLSPEEQGGGVRAGVVEGTRDQRYRAETELFVNNGGVCSQLPPSRMTGGKEVRKEEGTVGWEPQAEMVEEEMQGKKRVRDSDVPGRRNEDESWERMEQLVDRIAQKQLLGKTTETTTQQQQSIVTATTIATVTEQQQQRQQEFERQQRQEQQQDGEIERAGENVIVSTHAIASTESTPITTATIAVGTVLGAEGEEGGRGGVGMGEGDTTSIGQFEGDSGVTAVLENMSGGAAATDDLSMWSCALDDTSSVTSSQLAEQSQLLDERVREEGGGGMSAGVLQAIRQQMAVSLQRMRELEEQVKVMSLMQSELIALREENRRLLAQQQGTSCQRGGSVTELPEQNSVGGAGGVSAYVKIPVTIASVQTQTQVGGARTEVGGDTREGDVLHRLSESELQSFYAWRSTAIDTSTVNFMSSATVVPLATNKEFRSIGVGDENIFGFYPPSLSNITATRVATDPRLATDSHLTTDGRVTTDVHISTAASPALNTRELREAFLSQGVSDEASKETISSSSSSSSMMRVTRNYTMHNESKSKAVRSVETQCLLLTDTGSVSSAESAIVVGENIELFASRMVDRILNDSVERKDSDFLKNSTRLDGSRSVSTVADLGATEVSTLVNQVTHGLRTKDAWTLTDSSSNNDTVPLTHQSMSLHSDLIKSSCDSIIASHLRDIAINTEITLAADEADAVAFLNLVRSTELSSACVIEDNQSIVGQRWSGKGEEVQGRRVAEGEDSKSCYVVNTVSHSVPTIHVVESESLEQLDNDSQKLDERTESERKMNETNKVMDTVDRDTMVKDSTFKDTTVKDTTINDTAVKDTIVSIETIRTVPEDPKHPKAAVEQPVTAITQSDSNFDTLLSRSSANNNFEMVEHDQTVNALSASVISTTELSAMSGSSGSSYSRTHIATMSSLANTMSAEDGGLREWGGPGEGVGEGESEGKGRMGDGGMTTRTVDQDWQLVDVDEGEGCTRVGGEEFEGCGRKGLEEEEGCPRKGGGKGEDKDRKGEEEEEDQERKGGGEEEEEDKERKGGAEGEDKERTSIELFTDLEGSAVQMDSSSNSTIFSSSSLSGGGGQEGSPDDHTTSACSDIGGQENTGQSLSKSGSSLEDLQTTTSSTTVITHRMTTTSTTQNVFSSSTSPESVSLDVGSGEMLGEGVEIKVVFDVYGAGDGCTTDYSTTGEESEDTAIENTETVRRANSATMPSSALSVDPVKEAVNHSPEHPIIIVVGGEGGDREGEGMRRCTEEGMEREMSQTLELQMVVGLSGGARNVGSDGVANTAAVMEGGKVGHEGVSGLGVMAQISEPPDKEVDLILSSEEQEHTKVSRIATTLDNRSNQVTDDDWVNGSRQVPITETVTERRLTQKTEWTSDQETTVSGCSEVGIRNSSSLLRGAVGLAAEPAGVQGGATALVVDVAWGENVAGTSGGELAGAQGGDVAEVREDVAGAQGGDVAGARGGDPVGAWGGDENYGSLSPDRLYEVSEEMLAACTIYDHWLSEPDSVSQVDLKLSVELIQHHWFYVAGRKMSNSHEVRIYLATFAQFSDNLIEAIVNLPDNDGNTTLHYAVSHGNFDVVAALLETAACDVNRENRAGYSALLLVALLTVDTERHKQLIHHLFTLGDINAMSSSSGQTALMLAASHGRLETVELLVDCGADVNAQDEDGSTALMCASEHGHTDIIKALLAVPTCDSTIADIDGSTALSIAVEEGHQDIGVLLYAHMKSIHAQSGEDPREEDEVYDEEMDVRGGAQGRS